MSATPPSSAAEKDADAQLLVVDDEPNIRDLLSAALRFAGFNVTTAANGNEALKEAHNSDVDLIVLDVMMPDMDGFTVTRRLRDTGIETPVLFLTARDDPQDTISGLTVGGDDYVTKPFSLDEVVARIRAILRRTKPQSEDEILHVGALTLNEDLHEVKRGEEVIELSPTEFTLLRYLMLNAGRVISKHQILDHVWDYGFEGDTAIVESYVSYLRRKIDTDEAASFIVTKRGVGYLLRDPETA